MSDEQELGYGSRQGRIDMPAGSVPMLPTGTAVSLIRIEALRAAAMLVGAALSADQPLLSQGKKIDPVTATKTAAEQFAAWLEGK